VVHRIATLLTSGSRESRELQESKARLEEAQRVAHIGYWVWNLDRARVTWSDEAYRIFELEPQEGPIDLATVREMIHPEDRESVFRTAEDAIRDGVRADSEHRLVRPNWEVRTVHSQGEVKRDASGRPYQMFGTIQDMTDRKRAAGFAILQAGKVQMSGIVAWLAWAGVHLQFLATSTLRLTVFLQWIWSFLPGRQVCG
jgi:PAS domain-containing protein